MTTYKMERQLEYIKLMFADFAKNAERNIEMTKTEKSYYQGGRFMNKDCGKSVLKRKIIALRQELLKLERMIDEE